MPNQDMMYRRIKKEINWAETQGSYSAWVVWDIYEVGGIQEDLKDLGCPVSLIY